MTLGLRRGLAALTSLVAVVCVPTPAVADLAPPPPPLVSGPVTAAWPDPPDVGAPVFLLVDALTGQVLAARSADERRPVASTVKILTALTVRERLDLDAQVEAGPEVEGLEGASVDLEPGERWTVEQILEGLLVRSGNDAASAAAVEVGGTVEGFVELMTEDAQAVGLRTDGPDAVVITSPNGLDDAQRFSARDLATLARVLLADPDLRAIVGAEEVTLPDVGTDENRNLLIGEYPGATGVKTGYTEAAGNSVVASAERDGRELIAVVLGAGPDPERFTDAAALLDHGFERFTAAQVARELTLLVAGGTRRIELEPTPVTAPTDAEVTVDLPLPIRPPERDELPVPVHFDAVRVATATATVTADDAAPVGDGARVGRALADGVYAALRAGHAGGRLP